MFKKIRKEYLAIVKSPKDVDYSRTYIAKVGKDGKPSGK
jgi:hypothetical protein